VAQGSLAKVPAAVNADKLGGFSAAAYHRAVANASGAFSGYLMPSVTGYGAYGLYCAADGVHWADNLAVLGTGARSIKNLSWSDGPYTASETDTLLYLWNGSGAGFATSNAQGERFYGRSFVQNAAGTKKLIVEAWGTGNSTLGCWGGSRPGR